jgi:hypothetical protein
VGIRKRTTSKKPCSDSSPYGKVYQDEAKEILPQIETTSEAKLYLALLSMRNAKTHRTNPTGDTLLSEVTGLDPRSIIRARKVLKAKGLISTTGGRGRGVRTIYRFTWLPPKDEGEDTQKDHKKAPTKARQTKDSTKAEQTHDEYDTPAEPFKL